MRGSAVAAAVGVMMFAAAGSALGGPVSSTVRVPNVVGQPESRAQCALAAAGLRWRYRGDNHLHSRPIISCSGHGAVNPDPAVISQSPRAGSRAKRHGVVVLDDQCLRRVRHHNFPCA
jgi:beta-lactam-binding protein with PASTA domain